MYALVYGTRPELIKLFPVIRRMREMSLPHTLVSTGQHGEVLSELELELGVRPDICMSVLRHGLSGPALLGSMIEGLSRVLPETRAAAVVSQGDTFTVLAASTVAFMLGLPHAHVEAGLRSGDLSAPFPEEYVRRVAAISSSLHFAPTTRSVQNLLAEGVPDERVHLTGNTIVDMVALATEEWGVPAADAGTVLVTAHRRENWGRPISDIAAAVAGLCRQWPGLRFVWPMHPNPELRESIASALGEPPANLELRRPMGYRESISALAGSRVVLTDSGGLQEEAACLGKDVIVLRESTERPELVESGHARLCGHDTGLITKAFGEAMSRRLAPAGPNPLGDGNAARRIVDAICAAYLPSADAGWPATGLQKKGYICTPHKTKSQHHA